ncbi:Chaperone protein DnaJ [Ilyonectria robusta]
MTSLPPDPYKTLGVSKDAQITEIRSAHRKLVLKCHPDKVQDPALKALKQDEFQKVQQAYELLSDEKERQRYDDQARIAELRKQMQSKANTSSPRATPTTYKFDIRTAEPRPNSYKSTSGTPPGSKFYPRSYEDDRGPQIFDAEPRKEAKELKEARRAEKKKEREKERKREAVDKKQRDKPPYLEPYEDEPVKEKKKSSKKHDEKRDRSSHREEAMPRMSAPPPPMPDQPWASTLDSAVSYIEAKNRSKAYHPTRVQPPAAPTPPPAPGLSSPFSPPPDDDVRRSAAKSRRGSSGEKKAYKKASHEVLEDPVIVDTSPSAHYAQKSATAAAALSGSPPRRELHRQHTMPISAERFSRPIPNMSRSQTFTAGSYPEMVDPRGRGRSKLQPQIEESDSEDEHAQRRRERRERKHSSKKHHSPEPHAAEYVQQYKVEGGRTVPQNSYTRNMDPTGADAYGYYPSHARGIQVQETRPSMSARDASYSSSPGNYTGSFGTKVKTSKAYDFGDVAYSNTYAMYHEDYAQAY